MCVFIGTHLSHFMNNNYICDLQIVDIYKYKAPLRDSLVV